MRGCNRLCLVVVVGGLMSLAAAPSALAVSDSTSVELTTGGANVSFTYNNAIPALSGATLTGLDISNGSTATLATFDITDFRGNGAGWNVSIVGQAASTTANPALKLFCVNSSGTTPVGNGECVTSAATPVTATNQYHSCAGISTIGCTLGTGVVQVDTDLNGVVPFLGVGGTDLGANAPLYQCNTECIVAGDSTTSRKLISAAVDTGMGTFTSQALTNDIVFDVPAEAYATAASSDTSYQMDTTVSINNIP